MKLRCGLIGAMLTLAACAPRHSSVYRLTGDVLIPPHVRDASVSTATLKVRTTAPRQAKCTGAENGLAIDRHRHTLLLSTDRDALIKNPPGWLSTWAAKYGERECVSAAEAFWLPSRIAEALPLNPATARTLIYGDPKTGRLDLSPAIRIRVISPILRATAPPGASALTAVQTSGDGHTLNLTVKSSPDLLGYESAWYALKPRKAGPALTIEPISAQANVGKQVVDEGAPRRNYFTFSPVASYFRLFFLTRVSRADHDIAVLGARTPTELERLTERFEANPDTCAAEPAGTCVLIPAEVAVLPHVTVSVNGDTSTIWAGATLADVVRLRGVADPKTVLPTLTVRRPYGRGLMPVQFDRTEGAILRLPLIGGEDMRW